MKVKRKPSDGRIMVSKHYHLAQFCLGAAPNPFQVQSIFKLAARLEELAKSRGFPPVIVWCMNHVSDTALQNAEAVEFYGWAPSVNPTPFLERITL